MLLWTRKTLACGLAALLCASGTWAAEPTPIAEAVVGKSGVVASRSRLASEVGLQVLKSGGNAVDAAVAVGFALAVTHPSAGNLGGGGFLVMRLADGDVVANDHREVAPKRATRDMYLDEAGEVVAGLSTASHLASGVPGTVDGLLSPLARYGTLDARTVLAPAIRLARDGFPLPEDLAAQFARHRERFAPYPASAAKFTKADGTAYAAGDLFRQPDLAATLERIAAQGRDGFYAGRTADLLVAEMERGGGLISHEDLKEYRSVWRQPVRGSYRGHDIYSMPPPSSGGVLLVQLLNMLETHDVNRMGADNADTAHLMIEAERRAYADRAEHLGDPDFYDVPMAMLIDKAYATARLVSLDRGKASLSTEVGAGARWPEESPETTHVSIVDAAGNCVAYTTTLNLSYGSKIVVTGAGFLLNNEMDDFSAKPDAPNSFGLVGREANAIVPGKRMLSSMTPTIVLKKKEPFLVTGSPGGSTIITTVLQVVVNVIDHRMDLAAAVSRPRFHHQWLPNRVVYEPGAFSESALETLTGRGHVNLNEIRFGIGDANSAMRLGENLIGVADPRNAGAALAF